MAINFTSNSIIYWEICMANIHLSSHILAYDIQYIYIYICVHDTNLYILQNLPSSEYFIVETNATRTKIVAIISHSRYSNKIVVHCISSIPYDFPNWSKHTFEWLEYTATQSQNNFLKPPYSSPQIVCSDTDTHTDQLHFNWSCFISKMCKLRLIWVWTQFSYIQMHSLNSQSLTSLPRGKAPWQHSTETIR